MKSGIKALVDAISREELVSKLSCDIWVFLEEAILDSQMEDVSKQDRGKDPSSPTRGMKEKSRVSISSFKRRIAKL